jgi:hypothetical protein
LFHPIGTGTIRSALDHEIAHQIDSLLKISNQSEIISLFRKLTYDEIVHALSEYATKSRSEFIAEAWSEYLNNPNPRPIAKQIGELIMRLYTERKK